jgi:hypothetical protein
VEGFHPRPFGCVVGSQFLREPRFPGPPFSSRTVGFPESGWRLWHFPIVPSLKGRNSSADSHTPLTFQVCPMARHGRNLSPAHSGSVSRPVLRLCPPSAESPFAPLKRYLSGNSLAGYLEGRYSFFFAQTSSCARPKSLPPTLVSLVRWVFAGCCQPLLGDGPSRRYLHNPCMGAWTRTPPRSTGALTRFLPDGHRPHLRFHRFGAQNLPRRGFDVGLVFRGCSHLLMFRLPCSLGPLTAPTAVGSVSHQAAGPFTPRNGRTVACSNCGIATCLNRVINMTGLAPVGLWPCRPLPFG